MLVLEPDLRKDLTPSIRSHCINVSLETEAEKRENLSPISDTVSSF